MQHQDHGGCPLIPKEETLRAEAVGAGALANEQRCGCSAAPGRSPTLCPAGAAGARLSCGCSARRVPAPPLRSSRLKAAVPLEGKLQRQTAGLRDAGSGM